MLNSLYIRNYRCLKDFKINRLSRINLLTGKNNTGKSSILEAIAIYASNAGSKVINKILEEHNENFFIKGEKSEENFIKSFSSLFTNRIPYFNEEHSIYIGHSPNNSQINDKDKYIQIQFANILEETSVEGDSISFKFNPNLNDDSITFEKGYRVSLMVKMDNLMFFFYGSDYNGIYPHEILYKIENFQLVRSNNVDRKDNAKLFDSIAITDKEQYVIEALKIIEPGTERITFIESDSSLERIPVIRLAGLSNTIQLKSMGDGINRILTIILAMVNAENGYLLIDEFENGLHYTSQIKLWEIIFKLAEKLNVQVFATTHSEDCIFSFERILNSIGNKEDVLLIRLDKKGDEIKYTEFDSDELRIANERNIEIR